MALGTPAAAGDGAGVALALVDARALVDPVDAGDAVEPTLPFDAPAWTEDGRAIRVATAGGRGAVEVTLASGTVRGVEGLESVAAAGAPEFAGATSVSVVRDDVVVARGGETIRVTRGEDRFFGPRLSPDGTKVAFVGLVSGIHVADLDGDRLWHAGAGTRPAWSPDGRWLLFERTEDDGTQLTGGELMALSLGDGAVIALTDTADAIERSPAVSPDGASVAFVRDGALWVATLREATR